MKSLIWNKRRTRQGLLWKMWRFICTIRSDPSKSYADKNWPSTNEPYTTKKLIIELIERTEHALPQTMNKRLPGGMYMANECWLLTELHIYVAYLPENSW